MINKVIVLGNDHTNTLGVVQSLGMHLLYPIVFVWGDKTGIVKSSRYTKEIHFAADVQSCIEKMISLFVNNVEKTPIIACCDSAALALDTNKDRLDRLFLFEHVTGPFSFPFLFVKENQVNLASQTGFNVPKTWIMKSQGEIPNDLSYPCLIKPMVSCKGSKSDIRICESESTLRSKLCSLTFTKEVILQQYIEHDYELSILGCGKSDGTCYIPVVEYKLSLFPKNVGLECVSYIDELKDTNIINSISGLIRTIGYVGLFSVEMMHSKNDNSFYFTEINLRNDGANAMIYKYGVNLPLHFYNDITGKAAPSTQKQKKGYYIWDSHHLFSLLKHDISLMCWMREIAKSRGFMTFFWSDIKPFLQQYINLIMHGLKLRKNEQYS